MILVLTIRQVSLSDPSPVSAITSATEWINGLLFGPLAITVAVIAVAWIGFSMLSGRLDVRRGLSVLLGCFLLFGAREGVEVLRTAATYRYEAHNGDSPPSYVDTNKQNNMKNGYDPYAGAAVTNPRN